MVTKLCAILLMEGNFNYHSRAIFGKRMMDLARQHNMVPEEIYNKKGKTVGGAILQQVFTCDFAWQYKCPLIIVSLDTTQCYDIVTHTMMILTLVAHKVRQQSVIRMISPIQNMEYYLRTGSGESTTHAGGKHGKKQGLCQGKSPLPRRCISKSVHS